MLVWTGGGEPPNTLTDDDLAALLAAVAGVKLPVVNTTVGDPTTPFNWADLDPTGDGSPTDFEWPREGPGLTDDLAA